jgi:hypothetical protein
MTWGQCFSPFSQGLTTLATKNGTSSGGVAVRVIGRRTRSRSRKTLAFLRVIPDYPGQAKVLRPRLQFIGVAVRVIGRRGARALAFVFEGGQVVASPKPRKTKPNCSTILRFDA